MEKERGRDAVVKGRPAAAGRPAVETTAGDSEE